MKDTGNSGGASWSINDSTGGTITDRTDRTDALVAALLALRRAKAKDCWCSHMFRMWKSMDGDGMPAHSPACELARAALTDEEKAR